MNDLQQVVESGLFDVRDVAKFCRVSVRSVWAWVAAGKFPQPLRLGRLRR